MVGQLPRDLQHDPGVDPVFPADLDDVEPQARRQPEHSDDVHPDTRQFRVGGQSG